MTYNSIDSHYQTDYNLCTILMHGQHVTIVYLIRSLLYLCSPHQTSTHRNSYMWAMHRMYTCMYTKITNSTTHNTFLYTPPLINWDHPSLSVHAKLHQGYITIFHRCIHANRTAKWSAHASTLLQKSYSGLWYITHIHTQLSIHKLNHTKLFIPHNA